MLPQQATRPEVEFKFNNNTNSNHSMNSIPESSKSIQNWNIRAKTTVVATGMSSARSRPYDDEENNKPGKLGGGR